jgi:hypothetical protein
VKEAGEQRLTQYRWSSYPSFLEGGGKKPKWLDCHKVMDSLGLAQKQWNRL